MKKLFRILVSFILLMTSYMASSQGSTVEQLKPDPAKEKMYIPYLATRHGGTQGLQEWKLNNKVLYFKELWYFCESFSVKRDHLKEGAVLNESTIDITRFEQHRQQAEEAIVVLPGMRDALVLKPANELLYKPAYQ